MAPKEGQAIMRTLSTGSDVSLRAFTLIEIVLVLSIIGFLSSLAAPLFSRITPTLALKSAAHLMYSELHEARYLALKRRRTVEFHPNMMGRSYSLDGIDHDLPEGVSVDLSCKETDPMDAGAHLYYYSDGSADPCVITLLNDKRRIRLKINWLSGAIELDET